MENVDFFCSVCREFIHFLKNALNNKTNKVYAFKQPFLFFFCSSYTGYCNWSYYFVQIITQNEKVEIAIGNVQVIPPGPLMREIGNQSSVFKVYVLILICVFSVVNISDLIKILLQLSAHNVSLYLLLQMPILNLHIFRRIKRGSNTKY